MMKLSFIFLIFFVLVSCSLVKTKAEKPIREPSSKDLFCNKHYLSIKNKLPITIQFKNQHESFDTLLKYFDDYFKNGIPYTTSQGIKKTLYVNKGSYWSNHTKDEIGNIFESSDHALLDSINIKLQGEVKDNDFFEFHLFRLFDLLSNNRIGAYTFFEGSGAYVSLNLKLLKQKMKSQELPLIFTNVYDDYLNFLEKIYHEKLGISKNQFSTLREISKSLEGRTTLHFNTTTKLFEETQNPNFTPQNYFPVIFGDKPEFLHNNMHYADNYFYKKRVIGEQFEFTGGVVSVVSSSADELLPMEILHGIELPRYISENGSSLQIAEIGRMSSTISSEESLKLVKLAAVNLSRGWYENLHKVTKIYIEVDEVRRRLFKKYGFKDFYTNENLGYYKSGTDYVLEADVNDFLLKALESKI